MIIVNLHIVVVDIVRGLLDGGVLMLECGWNRRNPGVGESLRA
jgi:hypothetical protein